ncbi:glycoside hydrolase family 31 protein [Streptomyces sp. TX20-6-3]|uniref:glycoside hydrolase family 31 protein n=1 Tax=Streptomyces sp. TX20-6-3 TaxID=3028705 RepID=UPI0029A73E71|nr:TIM-barrel domain-containing protein [Streptomyces sp. TX20-6-3]MDX2564957.1 glycoside hydrolase family 31 protein [Streptomyces sp. TX20-6-3]
MDGRELVRSIKVFGSVRGLRTVRAAWRQRRTDAWGLPPRGAERARVPGSVTGADAGPGGGTIRFARSSLRICVSSGGTVFWGWDGAEPLPSYALAGEAPHPDLRASLEPDTDGGWRIVSERVTVAVSRHGAVEIRTPGGVMLRRDLPPRWWEPVTQAVPPGAKPAPGARSAVGAASSGGSARWVQRSEVPADARFFGLGGRSAGPRLRDGSYRLWNTDPGGRFGPGDDPLYLTMPVQFVVSDAGTHLAFHDNSWDGRVTLAEGEEGAGSGHDRPGTSEVRMGGGPLRCWVVVGTPARVLHGWAALTGAPALPPDWALGPQHARWGFGSEREVRRVVAGYRDRRLPLSAVHLDIDHYDGHRVFTVDRERFPDLPGLAKELREQGVRLVSIVDPAVKAEPGNAVYDSGRAAGAFVRDVRGNEVHGVVWPGECAYPDFTDPAVREWWGELYEERLGQGFAGVWHDMNEPVSFAPFGDMTLPRSARHDLDGRGGDHREAHNVYGLTMARAGYEGLRRLRPDERPFLFSRSGWAGMQRYGGTWSGDVSTGWPGLRASLALVLGLGLCGVPYSGPDVGGFDGSPTPELFLRWYQLGAWLPLFRTHAAIDAGRREPWEFGPEVLEHAREALAERERLRPYFTTLARLARMTGAPYVRPLWWGTPEDRVLRDCEDAFLLGDALLVAPVLTRGADRRAVRLPRGRWYDTTTGHAYEGPGQVLLDAPLSRVPVLARAGAVLAVRGDDGGLALEVWAPAAGRTGGGLVVRDTGDGWETAEIERYQSRLVDGRVVVERVTDDGVEPAGLPVRVRGV